MTMQTSSRNTLLDAIRAASALIVMVGHLRNAMLPDFQDLQNPSGFDRVFYLFSGMGHQAVLVFFVLSGYLVGGAALGQRVQFSVANYGVARLSRLWTTLIPALVLTWIADQVLLSNLPFFFQSPAAANWHSAPVPDTYSATLGTALANAFFLQTIVSSTFGTNGPLWSLANEAWYYAMFPLLMLSVWPDKAKRPATIIRLACATAVLIWCWWVPVSMALLFIPWLLGVAIHQIRASQWLRSKWFGALSACSVVVLLIACRLQKIPELIPNLPDLCLGIGVFFVLLFIHQRQLDLKLPRLRRASIFLSEISFSLYVIHMPLVFLMGGLLLDGQKIQHRWWGYGSLLAGSAAMVLAAWAFWSVFERNTPKVKAWMLHALQPRDPGKPLA